MVVKGDALHGVWETQPDAVQVGRTLFPDGRFLAQGIDHRFLELLGGYFAPPAAQGVA